MQAALREGAAGNSTTMQPCYMLCYAQRAAARLMTVLYSAITLLTCSLWLHTVLKFWSAALNSPLQSELGANLTLKVHEPVSMGLVAAAVLSEGVCSHDPAATSSSGLSLGPSLPAPVFCRPSPPPYTSPVDVNILADQASAEDTDGAQHVRRLQVSGGKPYMWT